MPNVESNVLSVCPFFVREKGNKITCEGILPDTIIETDFGSLNSKKNHQIYCCFSFDYGERCSLCKYISIKYE